MRPTLIGRPRRFAVVLSLLIGGSLLTSAIAGGQSTVERLPAADAVEAGIAASRLVVTDGAADHVVLVRDDRFADALVAGPLTGELPGLAPVLFTAGDALDARTAEEIQRATGDEGTVHIIGGSAAVSPAIESDLRASGYAVQRVAGATRLETALAVFDTYFADDLAGGDVMVARAFGSTPDEGDAWPDAVTGGAFGAARGVPVLLTPTDAVPDVVLDRVGLAGAALVLGGTAAVGDTAASQLAAVVPEVLRVAGDTREATAVAVVTDLFGVAPLTADDVVVLVNDRTSFAFGLAAAVIGAAGGDGSGEAPLLLVTADSPVGGCGDGPEVATPTACYLAAEDAEPGRILILGDDDQISPAVEAAVAGQR